ncbi:MAG: N-acetylmuramoyl-L-alanine amidase, partial [Pseudomonadota bacterium]
MQALLDRSFTPRAIIMVALAWCVLAFASLPIRAELAIHDLRMGQHNKQVRLVLETSQKMPFRVFTLENPARLVIDIEFAKWTIDTVEKTHPLIQNFRAGLFQPEITRIVADLASPIETKNVFMLPPDANHGARLVIDMLPTPNTKMRLRLHESEDWQDEELQLTRDGAETNVPNPGQHAQLDAQKPLIVLDPGHGGNDPGAIAITGLHEKVVVLRIAKLLKRKLEETGKYRVLLTRDRDVYIPLRQRFKKAEDHGADLFLSLHADSIKKHHVRGASVYTLSETASDKEAELLASRENRSDLVAGVQLDDYDDTVAQVLFDLGQRNTMQESAHFAEMVVQSLSNQNIAVLSGAHRFAGFAVLKSPKIPSVLIELGFLSNSEEA